MAATYTTWVGGRLPSDTEWELACRGYDGLLFPWGEDLPEVDSANYFGSGINSVVNVGSFPPNSFGLYDMAGNIREWTYLSLTPTESEVLLDKLPKHLADLGQYPTNLKIVQQGSDYSFYDIVTRCTFLRGTFEWEEVTLDSIGNSIGFRVVQKISD